jgi:hypothetical protein
MRRFQKKRQIFEGQENALKRGECFLDPWRLEAAPRFELGIRLLQSHALPLGYAAVLKVAFIPLVCSETEFKAALDSSRCHHRFGRDGKTC